jgi:phosphatidate cytidylyltransferase
MFSQRVLVTAVLLPIGIAAILAGEIWFGILIAIVLILAIREYIQLFQTGGFQPSGFMLFGGILVLLAARLFGGFAYDYGVLPLLVMLALCAHLIAFERGRDQAATDFTITLTGLFYIGYLGSYFLALRGLPEGIWWVLLVLPGGWAADSGAYLIGSAIGKHKLVPRLSPKKSWEGYIGGIGSAIIITPLLALLYRSFWLPPDTQITLARAAIIGGVMGVFPTLGDLGVSMFKRQFGVKDTGNLLPGHGGILDRIDSWLWMVSLGYLLIHWFFV